MSKQSNTLASLVSAALVVGALGATAAQAEVNPFSAVSMGQGVQLAGMEGSCGEGKCGEGKCGSGTADEKIEGAEAEGKCGEGKCGEGKCGSESKDSTDAEGGESM